MKLALQIPTNRQGYEKIYPSIQGIYRNEIQMFVCQLKQDGRLRIYPFNRHRRQNSGHPKISLNTERSKSFYAD